MGEIVGVVLAGGRGTRFGDGNKLLASLDGRPIVSRAARTLDVDQIGYTVAILGHDADRVHEVVKSDVDDTVENPAYKRGQSRAVRVGTEIAIERGADAALFLPGDMPRVDQETIERLVAAYRSGEGTIVAPTYEGTRGNPVLFDVLHFDALKEVTGDAGGRALFERNAVRRVDVDDPGVRLDVDTVDDCKRLRRSDSG
jgi:molybdenum cofactor cytidylyltransferase